jgi:glycosyltransferase involved in cell wall biosynthesis
MRILQVAPFVAPLIEGEQQLGGAQVIVLDLARGLARAGHDVTLAAADGSRISGVRALTLGVHAGELRPADLAVRTGPRGDDAAQRDAFRRLREWLDLHADEIDVVNAHAYDAPAFDAFQGAPRPVVHTLHLPPHDAVVVRAARDATDARLVTVSEANASAWRTAGVPVRDVIHNGVDVAAIPLSTHRGAHLIYAGRLSAEKGVEVALDVAERLGRGLLLVGSIYDPAYHARAIAPRVRSVPDVPDGGPITGAVYIGPRTRDQVIRLLGDAAVTLMPVRWEEPFGLVAVESLAAGTPVVAFRRGGLAEILDEHALVTPDDVAAFASAAEEAVGSDPLACRARAERFALPAMIDRYHALYASLA